MGYLDDLKSKFNNKDLFDQALTHRSWVNENPGVRGTNERLEFLGDAVLEYFVSKALYTEFSDKEEGFLTALRANLVNTINLAKVAREIDAGKLLFLSKGEEESGGRDNSSLLADTIEAIIGALYLDLGENEVQKFIDKNILSKMNEMAQKPLKDAKSRLQEKIQADGLPAPKYNVVSESGPDHAKKFTVEVVSNGTVLSKGLGKSKAEAEQHAAQKAIHALIK